MTDIRVAVIGAGISGLMCARTLADHGYRVVVFEKSRGVGGRMATRRALDGNCTFDHGAQYFTCRDDRFSHFIKAWCREGIVAPWGGRIVAWEKGVVSHKIGTERFVAVPGMNALCKSLAREIDVVLNCRVAPPRRTQGQWELRGSNGDDLGTFDAVIASAPAGQTVELLSASKTLADEAARVGMSGCWTVMLALETAIECDFDAAFVHNSPLSWIARNNSKPKRQTSFDTWVLHASPEWSEMHIDTSAEEVEAMLLQEFGRIVQQACLPIAHQASHLWRFALPQNPLPEPYLFDEELLIGACGDWCGGPRVEGAFLSGIAVAERILQSDFSAAD